LLDTNAVLSYLNASLSENGMHLLSSIIDDELMISIITKMEIMGFNFPTAEEEAITDTFINSSIIFDINNDIVNKTIAVRKLKKIKLPDAIIASTAIIYNLVLVSRNISDFKNIEGLQVLDPHSL